jgi:hypothetical protein
MLSFEQVSYLTQVAINFLLDQCFMNLVIFGLLSFTSHGLSAVYRQP